MGKIKVCEYCGKEFWAKSDLAKTCSLTCRVKMSYHTKNPNARYNVLGKQMNKKDKNIMIIIENIIEIMKSIEKSIRLDEENIIELIIDNIVVN